MVVPKPSLETVWKWIATIPDPEIPVISVTDLGVVREVQWAGDVLEVTVTPTYCGCPATRMINSQIEAKLQNEGIEKLRLNTQISPAWTTEWLSEKGRESLEAYGIAAPQPAGGPNHCPKCRSQDVERISQFGSAPCKALWRCRDCLEPFDYFKCI
ncbi:MAG: 1,2-phenylacetyl-CoA epoxidase subunit PaaD [Pseudomonadota bacterium]